MTKFPLSAGAVLRRCGAVCAALASAATWALEPVEAPSWVLTQDGAYAINLRDKLAWPRCVEGMQWNGKTCTGKPVLATYAEAVALAASRKKTDGVDWRLPSVPELQHLLNGSASSAATDLARFPLAPLDWYWSGTANITTEKVNPYNYGNISQGRTATDTSQLIGFKGWAVNLGTGESRGNVTKRSRLLVRLVASQD